MTFCTRTLSFDRSWLISFSYKCSNSYCSHFAGCDSVRAQAARGDHVPMFLKRGGIRLLPRSSSSANRHLVVLALVLVALLRPSWAQAYVYPPLPLSGPVSTLTGASYANGIFYGTLTRVIRESFARFTSASSPLFCSRSGMRPFLASPGSHLRAFILH